MPPGESEHDVKHAGETARRPSRVNFAAFPAILCGEVRDTGNAEPNAAGRELHTRVAGCRFTAESETLQRVQPRIGLRCGPSIRPELWHRRCRTIPFRPNGSRCGRVSGIESLNSHGTSTEAEMPGRLDETRPFLPVNIALLTVSTPATRRGSLGQHARRLPTRPGTASRRAYRARRFRRRSSRQLRAWIADPADRRRDRDRRHRRHRPRRHPGGVSQRLRKGDRRVRRAVPLAQLSTIGTSTIQSRATAGVAGGTYLFALPGSPSACRDAWAGHPRPPARQPLPPVQFRRADAAIAGAQDGIVQELRAPCDADSEAGSGCGHCSPQPPLACSISELSSAPTSTMNAPR